MIVKKLKRTVKCLDWNKEKKEHEVVITRSYVGYFLFGIIPIYLKLINKEVDFHYDVECHITYDVYKKYGDLI